MRIQLERIRAEHLPVICSWITSNEELVQWSGPWNFVFPLDQRQLGRFFLTEALDDEVQRKQFIAVDCDTESPVGQIGFSRIWTRTDAAHLGPVIVQPAARGRGIASRMVTDLLRIGFEDLGLHRIELVVFDFNRPAIACYQRAGFRAEGTLRDIVRVGGEYWNWRTMSILDHEYSA